MWLYHMLYRRYGENVATLGIIIYGAFLLIITLLFALEPQSGFRYAQL